VKSSPPVKQNIAKKKEVKIVEENGDEKETQETIEVKIVKEVKKFVPKKSQRDELDFESSSKEKKIKGPSFESEKDF
jgi:hypothetical protein